MRYFSVGLVIIVYLTVMLNFFLSRNKSKRIDYGKIFDEESRANAARKKEIGDEFRVAPDFGALPSGRGSPEEETALKAGRLPMMNFGKSMTNNELKLAYGAANLENITRMEENYDGFIRAMIDWAKALTAENEPADAEAVLNETVRLRSGHSGSYTLLADIYHARGDYASIDALREKILSGALPFGVRKKIIAHIDGLTGRE